MSPKYLWLLVLAVVLLTTASLASLDGKKPPIKKKPPTLTDLENYEPVDDLHGGPGKKHPPKKKPPTLTEVEDEPIGLHGVFRKKPPPKKTPPTFVEEAEQAGLDGYHGSRKPSSPSKKKPPF